MPPRPVTHILAVGRTLSGKSQFAKRLARTVTRPVLVYDRQAGRSGRNVAKWRGLVFTDWARFRRAFYQLRGHLVIIDDAAHTFRENRMQALPMMEEGRHYGHLLLICSQRYMSIEKTAREQASEIFVFQTDGSDARLLAELYDDPQLAAIAPKLPPLHYRRIGSQIRPSQGRVTPV